MEKYKEIEGDLIKLALKGSFDVIAHGANCQCIMGAGIAPQMAKTFGCDKFIYEGDSYKGSIDKLGTIDYQLKEIGFKGEVFSPKGIHSKDQVKAKLLIVNAYTQFDIIGRKTGKIDLDYEALTLCLRKINYLFRGKRIGLPQIGCGLAGGDWKLVKKIIQDELKDCIVTVVIYKPN
jgi:O-acetyl-ADP-ribose deacetylase (regulator of RNase III)